MATRTKQLAPGTVLILGGRSEIGQAVAERVAAGRTVVLAARNSSDLQPQRDRLHAAGAAAVHAIEFDADDVHSHATVLASVVRDHGPIGIAVLVFGILGDQQRAERESAHALQVIQTDYVAQVSVLTDLATLMRTQGDGHIVVFSSVAGVRVRRANYVYGSAKAGLDGFACGLADSLHGTGVHLLLVRPGFVIGTMTDGMKPAPFSSTPNQVADAVVNGLRRRSGPVWVPNLLRPVFFGMRLLPQPIWRRLPR
ncbi:SDR family NAD(P)-dependent oxidoreductase [Skermania sp. ID1734]|uniref:SDR family NAD(P)-dependent oxidoreductase n=1 Tax=Skermania sp. ID1734 TaxID=2597516 RepID=UPI00117DB91E|nr:SDR family NAD(P)-dependent oxidoreductase [Skermania sp. ID1734]TSE01639.1 SDR family NAD(P)-dependent oxidoreductase [Skermania sp. ID1734]